jgi:hypothetical protein
MNIKRLKQIIKEEIQREFSSKLSETSGIQKSPEEMQDLVDSMISQAKNDTDLYNLVKTTSKDYDKEMKQLLYNTLANSLEGTQAQSYRSMAKQFAESMDLNEITYSEDNVAFNGLNDQEKKFAIDVLSLLTGRSDFENLFPGGWNLSILDQKLRNITQNRNGLTDIIKANSHLTPVKVSNGLFGLLDKFKDVKEAKKFPDLTGDGKVTRADILKGRGVNLK